MGLIEGRTLARVTYYKKLSQLFEYIHLDLAFKTLYQSTS